MSQIFKNGIFLGLVILVSACSSSEERSPATNRAGRPYSAPKVMNRHSIDSNSLYNACVKERHPSYCNNRLGR